MPSSGSAFHRHSARTRPRRERHPRSPPAQSDFQHGKPFPIRQASEPGKGSPWQGTVEGRAQRTEKHGADGKRAGETTARPHVQGNV